MASLAGHEVMHVFEKRFPEEFARLVDQIQKADPDGWAEAERKVLNAYGQDIDADTRRSETAAVYLQLRLLQPDGMALFNRMLRGMKPEPRMTIKRRLQEVLRAIYKAFKNRKSFRLGKKNAITEEEFVANTVVDAYLGWVFDTMRANPQGKLESESPWGIVYETDTAAQQEAAASRGSFAFK